MKKIRKDTRKLIEEQMLVEQVRSTQFRSIKVSRREVEEFYSMYEDSLPSKNETVEIAHILKLVEPSPDAQAEAYQKIEDVLNQLKSGSEFAELAQKFSDDPASAKRGGDLGMMSRGDFVPEFENAAFQLEDGQISDIVQTQFGYHIIKMIERRGEKIHTQHILVQMMPTEDDEKRTIDFLKELKAEHLNGADFSELAVKSSDDENVSQDQGVLGTFDSDRLALPQFKTIVDELNPGEVSDPFKTEYGYHIVLLKSRNATRRLSLDTDWQELEQMALNYKMEKEYAKWIENMKKTVNVEIRDLSS
jgi:peptidyl-prolyl cis-trans isomerase SurA